MRTFFKDYNLEWLPSIMVILFFAIFIYIVINVFRNSNKEIFDHESKLPLKNGEDI